MSKYYLVDTNVLLAASHMATQLKPEQVAKVKAWLSQFQHDANAYLLLDSEGAPAITRTRILEEYLKKMSKTDFGWQAIKTKLATDKFLCYRIAYEGVAPNEYAVLPETLTRGWRDPADRKFMAVALEHIRAYPRQRCQIVNATDTDWAHYTSILRQHFIEVEQLLM